MIRPLVFRVLAAAALAAAVAFGPSGATVARADVPIARAAAAAEDFGLTPSDIHTAYALPRAGAAHQTIAIISAYEDPAAQADLNAYTSRFHLPPCTAQNHCFRKLNQTGAARPLPGADPTGGTWTTESSAGIELARAVCQSCSIMLVEANIAFEGDFASAANAAANAGATVVSVSFNPTEQNTDGQYLGDFTHPRTAVVAASGDGGYVNGEASFPSGFPQVLAVGGTNLQVSASGGYRGETAWYLATSGCSAYETAGLWQMALARSVGCGNRRAIADLSATAEPGALVHVTDVSQGGGPWYQAIGTSVAAPIIAGAIGLAGSAGSHEVEMLYRHARSDPGAFHDVRSGSTQYCQGGAPICAARPGFDGPTGLGTPHGLAAFLADGGALNRRHPGISSSAIRGRLRVGSGWTARLPLRNGNPFTVTGTATLERVLRVGGRLRTVRFGTTTFRLGPLAGGAPTVRITGGRSTLASRRSLLVTLQLSARGEAGRTVTQRQRVTLLAP